MTVRVYLPLTLALLDGARTRGAFGPAPLLAHAVTEELRGELDGADEEECEFAAMTAAGQASVALLGPDERPVRVVAAVDVPAVAPVPGSEDATAVTVPGEVPLRRLAAVHVDSPEAEPAVAAARAALGGDSAEEALDLCLDHDLAWYAAQELDELLGR